VLSAATLSVVCTTSVARLRSPAGTENFLFATVSGAHPMGTRRSVGGQSDTLTPQSAPSGAKFKNIGRGWLRFAPLRLLLILSAQI
jgi:hypothetical protein